VIRGHVSIESVIHTDGWRGYNGLVEIDWETKPSPQVTLKVIGEDGKTGLSKPIISRK